MVTVAGAMAHVKENLDQWLPEDQINDLAAQTGMRWRKRQLDPPRIIWLFLLQLLANVSLAGLRRVGGVNVTAQALCAARMRLSLGLLSALLQWCVPPELAELNYGNLKVYIVDGVSFMTPDTPELKKKYGKHKNQRGTSRGYPTPKALMLMEAASGFVSKATLLPCDRQEYTCLSRLFKAMKPGSLLLGDRALVSFAHMVLLQNAAQHGCFRLPRERVVRGRGKGCRRRKQRLGKQDMLVTWSATSKPSWMSKRRWKQIVGQELTLRQIAFRICRKGFATTWAWMITTLTDPKEHPAQELIELYGQRWQIEVYFRDLKQTLNMKTMSAKTVAGVQKELMLFLLLYNLIRKVMCTAAAAQGVPPDRISFTDAMNWLLYALPGSPLPRLIVNKRRVRETQPRKLKSGRHRFPQMKQERETLCKPPSVVQI